MSWDDIYSVPPSMLSVAKHYMISPSLSLALSLWTQVDISSYLFKTKLSFNTFMLTKNLNFVDQQLIGLHCEISTGE